MELPIAVAQLLLKLAELRELMTPALAAANAAPSLVLAVGGAQVSPSLAVQPQLTLPAAEARQELLTELQDQMLLASPAAD